MPSPSFHSEVSQFPCFKGLRTHSLQHAKNIKNASTMVASMQGNCTDDLQKKSKIKDVHSAQLKPGQCVLVTSTSTLAVEINYWLDNIYIMQRPGKFSSQQAVVPSMIIVKNQGKLWATDVTVEGDRVNSQAGLSVEVGGQAFLDGALLLTTFLILQESSVLKIPCLLRD
jgi:hypothetical protein